MSDTRIVEYAKYIDGLETRIKILEEAVALLKAQLNSEQSSDNSKKPEIERNCLYFPSVLPNGTFIKTNAAQEFKEGKDGNSLYRFEINPDGNSASVYIEDNPSVMQVFAFSSESQMSACQKKNSHFDDAKGIETIEPGEVTLEGDKWTIKKKVQYRFI